MSKFNLIGVVDRTVTDVISLTVEAKTEAEAFSKAREVLSIYPHEHSVSGVPYVYVDSREWDEPEILDLRNSVKKVTTEDEEDEPVS